MPAIYISNGRIRPGIVSRSEATTNLSIFQIVKIPT